MNASHNTLHKASSHRPLIRLLGAALVALAALPVATVAQAAPRHHGTTVTGPQGNTASRSVQRGGGDVSATTTGFGGRSFSRQVDRSANGSSATVTGANGKTYSRTTTRADGSGSTTVTGPNGQSGTVTTTRQP